MTKREDVMFVPALMSFCKDGKNGHFDVVDGQFHYHGDLPASEAAKLLFENLVPSIDDYWLERARTKK